jgi:hypothetical protein
LDGSQSIGTAGTKTYRELPKLGSSALKFAEFSRFGKAAEPDGDNEAGLAAAPCAGTALGLRRRGDELRDWKLSPGHPDGRRPARGRMADRILRDARPVGRPSGGS